MLGSVSGLNGEFRKQALNEPLVVLPGDTATVVGNQVIVSRNGSVIGVRLLTGPVVSVPLGAEHQEVLNHILYFWRPPVSGVAATLTDVVKNTTTGSIRFVFSDGTDTEFASLEQAMSETEFLDTNNQTAKQIIIRKSLINSPDGTNLHAFVGAICAIDMNANSPVTFTP